MKIKWKHKQRTNEAKVINIIAVLNPIWKGRVTKQKYGKYDVLYKTVGNYKNRGSIYSNDIGRKSWKGNYFNIFKLKGH